MITDAIIPVAGRGTRLLPATRALPKELLPVVDKPVVQYVVEELAQAGVKRIMFVTGRHKRAIEDHFDHPDVGPQILYTRQPSPDGLGDAIRRADGFANHGAVVAVGDGIMDPPGIVPRLIDAFEAEQVDATVAVQKVPEEDVARRGIVVPAGTQASDAEPFEIADMIEKPDPGQSESRIALMGRFVLGPAVFAALRATKPDASGEVQLTDALRDLIADGGRVLAVPLSHGQRRHDIGSIEGYAATFLEYALRDPRLDGVLRSRLLDDRPPQ